MLESGKLTSFCLDSHNAVFFPNLLSSDPGDADSSVINLYQI